jgi:hypothetical protein
MSRRRAPETSVLALALAITALRPWGCGAAREGDRAAVGDAGGGEAGSTSAGSTSTSGPSGGSACHVDADCPGPRSACGGPACYEGQCGLDNMPMRAPCGEGSGKICDGAGACVECLDGLDNTGCESHVCVGRACAAPSCDDGVKNGAETAPDCGGPACTRCGDSAACQRAEDCESRVCASAGGALGERACAAPSCDDGVKNGAEGDADCGLACPARCGPGAACGSNGDCQGSVCAAGLCAPSCSDGVKDGAEAGVDCGLACPARCGPGAACASDGDCKGLDCDAVTHVCRATCADGERSPSLGETDVDCGGPICEPCALGRGCLVSSDCLSESCVGDTCIALATCADGVKNGGETDADCGGPNCPRCADGRSCAAGRDCESSVCAGLTCASPTCSDGVKNGGEVDRDCGGSCAARCGFGAACTADTDCAGGACDAAAHTCLATCTDGVKNGPEGGIDCGAACPARCPPGSSCGGPSDCASGVCAAGGTESTCAAPTCHDGVKNGAEAGVDCGVACAAPCPNGSACLVDADCASLVCGGAPGSLTCALPTCHDSVKNGAETDFDCGGGCPQKCPTFYGCLVDADCIGGLCDPASRTCAPTCTDGYQDGAETDVDCGGGCPRRCSNLQHCKVAVDCVSNHCDATGHCMP